MKTCYSCQKSLLLEAFNKSSRNKDGRQSICRKCISEVNRLRRESKHEEVSARQAEWYQKNSDRLKAKQRQYRADNLESVRQSDRNYKKMNTEKLTAHKMAYRARKKEATLGEVPSGILQSMIDFYGDKCMVPGCPNKDLTLDHILALANGGAHSVDNFQILCHSHNSSKGAHHSTDYRPFPRMDD